MTKHFIYILLLLCGSTLIKAQNNAIFKGGSTDGHTKDCYAQPSNLNSALSAGGNGDGHSKDCYIQTSNLNSALSAGGNGDGHSKDCYTQTSNLNAALSAGGNGDGYAKDCYTQSPVVTVSFSGGSNDGHAKDCYIQASNLNSIFSGGDGGDGQLNGCANEPLGCFLAINLGNDTTFCAGQTLTLNAGAFPGGATYVWQDGSSAQTFLVDTTGIYYVFVTDTAGCTGVDSITVTVNPVVTPTFTAVTPKCSGAAIANLPTTSTNSITGTWSPAINNTATTTYTFTPTAGQCATSTTMTITVNPNVTPTFAAVSAICSGGSLSALPTTSTNSITGTWSPAINNTATTTYTFIPTAGQCATNTTMTITVNPNVTPTFAAVSAICSGGSLSALPTTSTNSITGTWSPAINNTATTTYTFIPTAGQCATSTTMTITVNPNVTPTFTAVSPICSGGSLSALPTTSTNSITGTWSPAINNTATTTYTFTPTAGQCATTTTMTITVNPNVTPTFTAVSAICSGGSLSALPTTSTNSITGTWSPAINNTATTTYTFIPTAGQCATSMTMTITVNPNVTPTFTAVSAICSGGSLSALPTTSTNSITGTWSPAINNTATTTYTFTPTAGQCATTTTMTITVNPNVTPTFTAVSPICSGGSLSALPTTSTNSITGTWSPAINNTATTLYTFTPTAGQCATSTTMTITVNPNVTPTFAAVSAICSGGSLSALPTTSTNSITGTWSPAINNTATTTYTFTPTAGQCATTTTMTITVNPNVTPTFTAVSPICSGGSLSALPTTSTNSITGTWSPAINNTATTLYTFTPTAGLCATTTTMTITVNPITTTNLSNEITCQGDSALIFGTYQTIAGNYYDTLTASTGCDSILVKQLILNPIFSQSLGTVTICSGDSALILGNYENVAGTYSDTLTSINGCDSIVSQTLAVLSNSSVNLGNDTAFCAGNNLLLDAGSGNSYLWQDGLTSTQTYLAASSGLYYVTVSLGACSATDSINITVNPIVTTNLSNETVCQGDSALIFGTYQTIAGNYYDTLTASTGCDSILVKQLILNPTYNQNLGTVNICQGDSMLILGNYESVAGTYSDTLTSINGCDSIVTQTLSVSPSHNVNLGNDTTFCAGNSITLDAGAGASTYQWQNSGLPGYQNQTFTVSSSGQIYVVTTLGACITSDTINITVNPVVVTNLSNESVCQGDSALIFGTYQTIAGNYYDTLTASTGCDSILVKQLVVNPTFNYSLSPLSICQGDSALIFGTYYSAAGTYYDSTTTIFGCDSIVAQQLIVNPYHVIDLGPDTTVCENVSVLLDAGAGADTYLWQNTALPGYMNQTFGATGAGMYYVVATIGVCSSSDTINVNVIPTVYTNLANVEICQGDSALIFGNYESVAGTYNQVLVASSGCDSILVQPLIVHPNYFVPQSFAICQGDSIMLGGVYQTIAGTYYDTLSSTNGCDSIIATTLIVNPTYNTNTSATICDGDSILLGGSYQTIAGVYTDVYSSINGCDSTVNTTLLIKPIYVVNQNIEICAGDSIYLGGAFQNSAGIYTDVYTSSLGCDSTVITTLGIKLIPTETLTPITICDNDSALIFGNYQTIAGMYSTVITNGAANGCDSIVYQELMVNPTYQIVANATICSGDSIFLGGAYQNIPGVYVDVYASSLGCDSTITTTLNVINSFTININDTICAGDSILLAGAYQTLAGTYTELFLSSGGCDSLVITELYVNPLPIVTLSADPELILSGQSSQLTATGGGLYSWTPTTGLSCSNCANPVASPTETTLYTVEVNLSGCMVSDTITISVDSEFKIPEGFSPNGDGVNDVFEIVGISQFPNNKIIIVNRWGNKVFEATPYKSDWDGTSQFGITIGEKLPSGTYFYILDLGKTGPSGSQEIKGYIYINR